MRAILNGVNGSSRKFQKYLRAVNNQNALEVVEKLNFCVSPYGQILKKVVMSAISNAANTQKDVKSLYVKEAYVGRGRYLKRICFRGRGRTGRITRPTSNVTVVLKEQK